MIANFAIGLKSKRKAIFPVFAFPNFKDPFFITPVFSPQIFTVRGALSAGVTASWEKGNCGLCTVR